MMRRRREQGLSLLEMIAALTILSIGSVVLFSWLGQTTAQLTRFQEEERVALAKLQVVQFLKTQNPMQTPQGERAFEAFRIRWTSSQVAELRESISPANGMGLYQVSMYEVQVSTFDPAGREWFVFPVRLAGYQQVREPAASNPF